MLDLNAEALGIAPVTAVTPVDWPGIDLRGCTLRLWNGVCGTPSPASWTNQSIHARRVNDISIPCLRSGTTIYQSSGLIRILSCHSS
ncbi:hypothetical protein [Caballeronia sp. INML2]|jgi:hypothetical protein|uniref:hypothetical protein n=1 Tax=Caballeronia sp. INML2 TaxID=2921748 RepID=UPI0020290F60|nr:hypothetical protein [Caballeronia sp. INML2]